VKLIVAGNFVTDCLCKKTTHTSAFETSRHPFDCGAFAILQAQIHEWMGPKYIFTPYGKYELKKDWVKRYPQRIEDVGTFHLH
jgi:hypothetical protein